MPALKKGIKKVSHIFKSEQEAAKAMLLEVAALLNKKTIDYAVIGGWIPYLFNSSPIPHTGTYDVDIVLNTALSKDHVISALDTMVKESGYRRAPKNAFQIYRELVVNGEPMIFHVDFLHRKYADDTDNLIMQWGRYESISTPGTDIIFTENEIRTELVSGVSVNGNNVSVEIPFATEAGFLSSKGRSVGFGKRTRDAFDIFLVLRQSNDIDALKQRSKELLNNSVFRFSMNRLHEQFNGEGPIALQAAEYLFKLAPSEMHGIAAGDPKSSHTIHANIEIAKMRVLEVVNDFLDSLGIEKS